MTPQRDAMLAQEIAAKLKMLPPAIRHRLEPLVLQYEAQQRALTETADVLLRELDTIRQELERRHGPGNIGR